MKTIFTASIFWLTASIAFGQSLDAITEPTWTAAPLQRIRTTPLSVDPTVQAAAPAAPNPNYYNPAAPNAEDSTLPEIVALARSLEDDPLKIYRYVKNRIDYVPYAGCKKGALVTLLERSGNDFDQCALLVALFNAAKANIATRQTGSSQTLPTFTDVRYNFGTHYVPAGTPTYDDPSVTIPNNRGLYNWLGVTHGDVWDAADVIAGGGMTSGLVFGLNEISLSLERVWVQFTYAGVTYQVDPSFKTYRYISAVPWRANLGFQDTTINTGTTGPETAETRYNSLTGVTASEVETRGKGYVTTLVNYLKGLPNTPRAEDLRNRREIVPAELPVLVSDAGTSDYTLSANWPLIPATYCNQFTISCPFVKTGVPTVNRELYRTYTCALHGRSLTFRFDPAGAKPLGIYLDGIKVGIKESDPRDGVAPTVSGANVSVSTGFELYNFSEPFARNTVFLRSGRYALPLAWDAHADFVNWRERKLTALKAEGRTDNDIELENEALNVYGHRWMLYTQMVSNMIPAESVPSATSWVPHRHHYRFGRVGREKAPYIDIFQQLSFYPRPNLFQPLASMWIHSALEHLIASQVIGTSNTGASTVEVLFQANKAKDPVYWLSDAKDPNNANRTVTDAVVADKLSVGSQAKYSANTFTDPNFGWQTLATQASNANATTPGSAAFRGLVPRTAARLINQWNGQGYMNMYQLPKGTGSSFNWLMAISGPLSGGQGTTNQGVGSANYNPTFDSTTSNPGNTSSAPVGLGPSLSWDPVDMATGHFIFSRPGLQVGNGTPPRGMNLSFNYHGGNRFTNNLGVGFGWSHSLGIRLFKRAAVSEAFGDGGSALQAAPAAALMYLVEKAASRDDVRGQLFAVIWSRYIATLLYDNAVSIDLGDRFVQFLKMPDGSWEGPAGTTFTLTSVKDTTGKDTSYTLQERNGNTYLFNATGLCTTITDQYKKAMSIAWTGTKVSKVTDCYARAITFAYPANAVTATDGANTVKLALSPTKASVGSAIVPNLISITDPELARWTFIYSKLAATDPQFAVESRRHLIRQILAPSPISPTTEKGYTSANAAAAITVNNYFDELDRVIRQENRGVTDTSANGNRTWWLYYQGDTTVEVDPLGRRRSTQYDAYLRPIVQTDIGNRQTVTEYDNLDRPIRVKYPDNRIIRTDYNADHNPVKVAQEMGGGVDRVLSVMRYDSNKRLEKTFDATYAPAPDAPGAKYTLYGYNAQHSVTSVTSPEGRVTLTEHYPIGAAVPGVAGLAKQITVKSEQGDLITKFEYDAKGNPTKVTDPNLKITSTVYYPIGDLKTKTDPLLRPTEYVYNKRRQVTQVKLPPKSTAAADVKARFVTTTDYDAQGNAWRTTDSFGNVTRTYFTLEGKVAQTILPNGPSLQTTTSTFHAQVDRLAHIADNAGGKITNYYNTDDSLDYVTDPLNRHTQRYQYDTAGRVEKVFTPAPSSTAAEVATKNTYNARGELDYFQDALGTADEGKVDYGYDANGRRTSVKNRLGKTWNLGFDDDGNELSVTSPLNRSTIKTLHPAPSRPLVKTIVSPSGHRVKMEYDKLGRPLKVTDVDVGDNALSTADSSRREMVYDDVGNVLFVKEFRPANATILTMQAARTYDHLNRVKTFTVTGNTDARLNYTLLWTYLDPLNGYILTYPDGKTVRYDLDNRGRLASVTDWANRKTIYGYDGLGRPSSIDHANNTHRRLDYDAASQLKSIRELDKLGRLIALTQFTDYWPNGQVKGMFTAPKAKPFTSPTSTMTHDDDNRILTFNGSNVVHDPDGNMTTGPGVTPSTGGVWPCDNTYTYDRRNRLTSVTVPGSGAGTGTWSFDYNSEGNLVSTTKDSQTGVYQVNPVSALSQVLVSIKPNGNKTFYVYGTELLYEVDTDATGVETADVTKRRTFHYDQRGCTLALTAADGSSVTDRFDYSAYGTLVNRATAASVSASTTPFLFNGAYGIATVGPQLLNMRARWYHPGLMRFVSEDPIGFGGGMNWFAYADGDPLMNSDPSGLATVITGSYESTDYSYGRMATTAASRVGSEDYSRWASWNGQYFGQHKCNLFTYDVAKSSGFTPPIVKEPYQTRRIPSTYVGSEHGVMQYVPATSVTTGGPRPVRPSEFVDPNIKIDGWSSPTLIYTTPSTGMMISNGTHIGIATSDSTVASTSSNYVIPAMLMPDNYQGSGSVRDIGYSGWPGLGSTSIFTRYPTQTNYQITTTTYSHPEK